MRRCKTCRQPFKPTYNTMQATCGDIKCAVSHGKELQLKQRKEADKAFKKKVRDNDRSWHIKKLQAEFNKFIRLRDIEKPCISCQRHHSGQVQAGHYRTTGACPELRFVEDNCHAQCAPCNNHLSGNLTNYRPNLLVKIGVERLTWLEGPHEPAKYTIPELQEMIKEYRAKIREMETATLN